MKSSTAVIKVLYQKTEINYDEVIKMTLLFKYFLIINNSNTKIVKHYDEISNYNVLNNLNLNGLAGAYNMGIANLANINPQYVLFLDDDTDTIQLFDLFDDKFYSSFENQSVAAASPIYIDSNSKTRGSHILLSRFSFKRIPRDYIGVSNVSFMINSCSVWKYDALTKIGHYDEKMKIDHIDTDYCLRATEMGYRLILNSNYSFNHSIGNRVSYKILFKHLRSGNHSPERRRLIMLNSILVLRKHMRKYPILIYIIFERIVYEFLGIIVAEKNKLRKVKFSLLGLFEGLFLKIP